jgi:hypothetical protein
VTTTIEHNARGPMRLWTILIPAGDAMFTYNQYEAPVMYMFDINPETFEVVKAELDETFDELAQNAILDAYSYKWVDQKDGNKVKDILMVYNYPSVQYQMNIFELLRTETENGIPKYSLKLRGSKILDIGFGFVMFSKSDTVGVIFMYKLESKVIICRGYNNPDVDNFLSQCETIENFPVGQSIDIRPTEFYLDGNKNAFVTYR